MTWMKHVLVELSIVSLYVIGTLADGGEASSS